VRELIALAKARPGKIDYASSGNGSAQHLFGALFMSLADIRMMHIPYKGSAPATTDLIAGQVSVGFPGIALVLRTRRRDACARSRSPARSAPRPCRTCRR
jgi:tripartite-type tricarboxylate transporter receptor subunit TctC